MATHSSQDLKRKPEQAEAGDVNSAEDLDRAEGSEHRMSIEVL
jgi:hypothetical protein